MADTLSGILTPLVSSKKSKIGTRKKRLKVKWNQKRIEMNSGRLKRQVFLNTKVTCRKQRGKKSCLYKWLRWASPLYGFVQLIDDGLKHSFVGGNIWPMETSSEERKSSAFCITARLVRTLKGYNINPNSLCFHAMLFLRLSFKF